MIMMSLRVVGAGLARTGTASLKLALEQLLGGPCYHMFELFAHPAHVPAWHQAARGQAPDWDQFLGGYAAAVDLPASAFWRELATASPNALIILSVRESSEEWWDSISQTLASQSPPMPPLEVLEAGFMDMITAVLSRVGMTVPAGKDAMIAAYQRHNDTVRELAPPGRLLEWRPSDGWAPITEALGLPEPDMPFPRVNTRAEFRARFQANGAGDGEPAHGSARQARSATGRSPDLGRPAAPQRQ
jgi:Sulfotransferase domain